MISSNMSRSDHPSRVKLLLNSHEGRQAHILMDSVVMTDNLATVIDNEIDRVLGRLNDMREVEGSPTSYVSVTVRC